MARRGIGWLMIRMIVVAVFAGMIPWPVHAQATPGAICIAAFSDTNGNGVQDSGEPLLSGVHVSLSTGGAIIATHITDAANTQYCFENLLRGEYVVTFTDAQTYQPTTPNEGAFLLDAGERLTVDPFGAIPVPLGSLRANVLAEIAANQKDSEPFDPATRLLLATVGSMMVMLFMVGFGVVMFALFGKRSQKSVEPPSHIQPPRR